MASSNGVALCRRLGGRRFASTHVARMTSIRQDKDDLVSYIQSSPTLRAQAADGGGFSIIAILGVSGTSPDGVAGIKLPADPVRGLISRTICLTRDVCGQIFYDFLPCWSCYHSLV